MSRGLSKGRGLAPSTIKYSLHILPRAIWEADLELANKGAGTLQGKTPAAVL